MNLTKRILENKIYLTFIVFASLSILIQLFILFFLIENPNKLFWYDPKHYYQIGKDLSDGLNYSVPDDEKNIYRAPGYPFILSLIIKIVGDEIVSIRLLHIALFPMFLLVVYHLGTNLFNSRVGILSTLVCAFYPPYLYVPLTLYPESILILIYIIIAWVLFKSSQMKNLSFQIGLPFLITIAIMVRPTAIVWIPVSILYLWFSINLRIPHRIIYCLLIFIIPFIFSLLWIARNYSVHGTYIFSTAGSINLLMSYNKNATWKTKSDIIIPKNIRAKIQNAQSLSEKEKIRVLEAKKFIKNNPLESFKIFILHCIDLWNPIPSTSTSGGMAKMNFKLINGISYLAILIFGAFGFKNNHKNYFLRCLILLIILNTLTNGIVAVSVRYRMVTDFVIIIMAAFEIDALIIWYRNIKKSAAQAAS